MNNVEKTIIDCLVEHYNKVKDELDAMKKAQEPTECENTNKARIFCCSVCGYEVADIFIDEGRFEYPSINFCPNCGRKVKRE